jgi:hypothetical protein
MATSVIALKDTHVSRFDEIMPNVKTLTGEHIWAFLKHVAQVELRDDLPFAITTHPERLLSTAEQGKVWEEALGEYWTASRWGLDCGLWPCG